MLLKSAKPSLGHWLTSSELLSVKHFYVQHSSRNLKTDAAVKLHAKFIFGEEIDIVGAKAGFFRGVSTV